jgi:hypothetical protein
MQERISFNSEQTDELPCQKSAKQILIHQESTRELQNLHDIVLKISILNGKLIQPSVLNFVSSPPLNVDEQKYVQQWMSLILKVR